MKILRRGSFRNLYLLVLAILFALYVYKAGRGDEFVNRHRKFLKELKLRSSKVSRGIEFGDVDLDANGFLQFELQREAGGRAYVFPDSGLQEGTGFTQVDWHNHTQEELDKKRTGPGEQGLPHYLAPGLEKKREELFYTNGFNALLSDQIALDRALPDIRHPKCREKRYAGRLPTVSVVIPFFEEHWTTLLRTVMSVVNRSPPQILREIILVDDGCTLKDFLKRPLEDWLKENVPKAKIVRLPTRMGLITARQEGVKKATADVIVVLDSHVEVMINWLPPLLEPILADHRTVVCPLIDVVNQATFAYAAQDHGGRGAFDWRLFYKRLNLRPHEQRSLPDPFPNPVMNGGLFAMSRDFFWELGGYDEGIAIWGGEQYNLSFKIWMCGGRMLDAPCSRVGHIFRHAPKGRPSVKGDFLSKNYKRVATVWMGEYAEALYLKNPHLREVDPGDVSKEIEVRERLKCKSFKWFLEEVAPDLLVMYPPFEPPNYANGTIRSVAAPNLCMDNGARENSEIILYGCHGGGTQYFSLCWRRTLRVDSEQFCFKVPSSLGEPPSTSHCQIRNIPANHLWRYDPVTQTLQSKGAPGWCVEAQVKERKLAMAVCDPYKKEQRWEFTDVNKRLINEEFPPF